MIVDMKFMYGPAAIFLGKIPALDANFINPDESITVPTKSKTSEVTLTTAINDIDGATRLRTCLYNNMQLATKNGAITKFKEAQKYTFNTDEWIESPNLDYKAYPGDGDTTGAIDKEKVNAGLIKTSLLNVSEDINIVCSWCDKDLKKIYVILERTFSVAAAADGSSGQQKYIDLYKFNSVDDLNTALNKIGTSTATGEKKLGSTAKQLQSTIATWYKALRLIALVGLLSVLVYVGIRILISSTGQEKSKYKKMIVDWVAAICIVFILQYIMSFTMTIVKNIVEMFDTSTLWTGNDVLMTYAREKIGNNETFMNIFSYLIIYLALVIYTVIFIWHYLKRLVYLAFFTMIAPLIALTYPLDKIKDGQAQAFSMWLREYVFNALIPVIHILLYAIFIGSSIDFAKANPIYALVCIGFLIPAEKFVRKMFGFDKASTSSQLGAAAGGAMVMNAINKIGSKNQGGGNGKDEGSGSGDKKRSKNCNKQSVGRITKWRSSTSFTNWKWRRSSTSFWATTI